MATDDDQRETSETAARKRAAPTIDLDPSDVTDTTPGAEDKSAQSSSDKARTGWRARFGGRAKDPKDESGETVIAAAPVPSRIILAAVFSAAVVALLVSGLWNVISPGNSDPDIPPAQTSTIEDLNTRVTHLEDKPAAPADMSAVTKRLDALDASLAAIQKDVTGLREQMQSASAKIADLEKAAALQASAKTALAAAPAAAPAPDLSGVEGRLSKLEQQLVAAGAEAAAAAAKSASKPQQDDTPLRRALAASALDQAVQQGLPYAAALTTASKLSGGAPALKPLEPFAATGVPSADALSRELLAQLPKLQPAHEDKPAANGWLDHLRNSASRLVRVTRIDTTGADRAALLARLKTAAERSDLQQAENIVAQLPEQDRKALQGWLDKVHARAAALAASRAFNQTAAAALSSSSH
jgi:hypothetical protein